MWGRKKNNWGHRNCVLTIWKERTKIVSATSWLDEKTTITWRPSIMISLMSSITKLMRIHIPGLPMPPCESTPTRRYSNHRKCWENLTTGRNVQHDIIHYEVDGNEHTVLATNKMEFQTNIFFQWEIGIGSFCHPKSGLSDGPKFPALLSAGEFWDGALDLM